MGDDIDNTMSQMHSWQQYSVFAVQMSNVAQNQIC